MALTDVPEIVVRRLPLYLRALTALAESNHLVTSSQELAARLGISSAQIRKDLSYFGEFGKQGMGYEVPYLRDQLRRILQADRHWSMVLVGAGDLGHAIVNYASFKRWDYEIIAIFDNDPAKIGRKLGGLTIRPADELESAVRELGVQIGIIAVPAAQAQAVAERLIRGGVRAILNYAPVSLNLPPDVRVHSIDPVVGLQSMTYYLSPSS
ncbi:MAG: redox-sensing transcriptional repressor Rex [Anaerolineae bacterium]|nr:redox-sensing transcriptional repressor Rex [Anaerolineae bacterium]